MAYELEQFCSDVKGILAAGDGEDARESIRRKLEGLLQNASFVAANCGPDAEPGTHTLYHDPELDFMVLSHVHAQGRTSPPHDHGASWAIYGQAVGWTDMTEYDEHGSDASAGKADIEVRRKYRLNPGEAGVFGPHQIHAIHFETGGRFVRVTGTDLTRIATRRFDPTEGTVTTVDPNAKGDVAGAATA